MWSTITRQISFNGTVAVAVGGGSPALPLRGVLVDVYRVSPGSSGGFQFDRLNQAAALTTVTGDFSFANLAVPVQVQELIPSTPPYTPVEFTNPSSLPTLAFRISVDAEVVLGATTQGMQFVDVYDEREDVNAAWLAANPARVRVPLSGAPTINVQIPEGDPEAMAVAGIVSAPSSVIGKEFHFLRIGRAVRDEIGPIGDPGPDFANRPGYMTSSNLQATPSPSFFPGVRDAPFGGQLHIGGHFGSDFTPIYNDLYYTVSFWSYAGSLTNPFDPTQLTGEVPVADPLFNRKYILPTALLPAGQWQTLNLGPFNGTITAVEDPGDAGLIGSSVQVYKRPPLPNPAVEYWPFWDLIALWNSTAAPNDLIVMTLQAYQRTPGGSDTAPVLTKLIMDPSVNGHLPLTIDNRQPALKLFDWRTGVARFTLDDVVATAPFDPCGDLPVTSPQADRNECILLKYSVEDGSGNPHPHVASYSLGIVYTPRQVSGAPLEVGLPLRNFLAGGTFDQISGSYVPSVTPVYTVANQESVLVPLALDGWPPEPGGDPTSMGSQCSQYALAVGASCSVRTVNGWSAQFGSPSLNRHIIVRG